MSPLTWDGVYVYFLHMYVVFRGARWIGQRFDIRRGAHATRGVGARPRRLGPGERARVVCEL